MRPDARRIAYQVALLTPALLLGTLLWSKPPQRWLNGLMLRILEPRGRRKFKVHPREIEESRRRLRAFLPELQSLVAGSGYLVGGSLRLADIAAVSIRRAGPRRSRRREAGSRRRRAAYRPGSED